MWRSPLRPRLRSNVGNKAAEQAGQARLRRSVFSALLACGFDAEYPSRCAPVGSKIEMPTYHVRIIFSTSDLRSEEVPFCIVLISFVSCTRRSSTDFASVFWNSPRSKS